MVDAIEVRRFPDRYVDDDAANDPPWAVILERARVCKSFVEDRGTGRLFPFLGPWRQPPIPLLPPARSQIGCGIFSCAMDVASALQIRELVFLYRPCLVFQSIPIAE